MKTKTLLLSLFAGAFLCFSNASYAQYHSSGGGGGSSDGISGQNMAGVGVGFGGGFGGLSVGGYGVSSSPNYTLYFDHAINNNWAIGAQLGYQTVTWTDNFTDDYFNTQGNLVEGNYTESWKWTLISFMVRGTYHFTVSNPKFDPYAGIGLGYNSISSSYSNNDPAYGTAFFTEPTYTYSGVAYGIFVGAHYYFSSSIGLWGQLGYSGYASSFITVGLAFKF